MPTPEQQLLNLEFVKTVLATARIQAAKQAHVLDWYEDEGEIFIRFAYRAATGVVRLEYEASGLRDWAIACARSTIIETAATITERADPNEETKTIEYDEMPLARTSAVLFIEGIAGKLVSLLGELALETECLTHGFALECIGLRGDGRAKRLAQLMATERKNFLAGTIANFLKHDFSEMRSHYEILLPLAKRAKQLYRENRDRDWRGMIERGFAEFDTDVIGLFSEDSEDMADYPAVITENFKTTADLALLQAARICGMKGFECTSPRTLRDWMNKGKNGNRSEEPQAS